MILPLSPREETGFLDHILGQNRSTIVQPLPCLGHVAGNRAKWKSVVFLGWS